MKMTRSTSNTSIIGVMFMSPLGSSFLALMTLSAPWCACAWAMSVASTRLAGARAPFCDEAHVFDPSGAELVHRFHHLAVRRILVCLDEDDLLRLVLDDVADAAFELRERQWHAVHVVIAVGGHGHHRLILRLRLVDAVGSGR